MAHSTRLYCSTEDLKAALAITATDAADDALLHTIAETASRLIDDYTGTQFYSVTGGTAYYTAKSYGVVEIDPFASITSVATDDDGDGVFETTWAATDYVAHPLNYSLLERPITALQVTPDGNYAFPMGLVKAVRIVGNLGWPNDVPAQVKQAAILTGTTLYESRKAPFGIVGSTETGVLRMSSRLHPEAQLLLEGFRLHDGVVA